MRDGDSKSCGCQTSSIRGITARKKDSALKYNFKKHKHSAKSRDTPPLSYEDWLQISTQPCAYCGAFARDFSYVNNLIYAATRNGGRSHVPLDEDTTPRVNGIDRVDSAREYTMDNCVACCAQCNRMKLDYSVLDWFDQIKRIVKHAGLEE